MHRRAVYLQVHNVLGSCPVWLQTFLRNLEVVSEEEVSLNHHIEALEVKIFKLGSSSFFSPSTCSFSSTPSLLFSPPLTFPLPSAAPPAPPPTPTPPIFCLLFLFFIVAFESTVRLRECSESHNAITVNKISLKSWEGGGQGRGPEDWGDPPTHTHPSPLGALLLTSSVNQIHSATEH